MKFDETKQYVIEENGVLVVKDLPIEEQKLEEHIFEPAQPVLPKKQVDERIDILEKEQEQIVDVLAEILGGMK